MKNIIKYLKGNLSCVSQINMNYTTLSRFNGFGRIYRQVKKHFEEKKNFQ